MQTEKEPEMLIAALLLNLVILVPLVAAMVTGST